MCKVKLAQLEAFAFSLYLKLKEVRKEVEKIEIKKQQLKSKLYVIKGGKPDGS